MSIRKVEPFAGAAWVIDGVKLWWRDPRGFGLYGLWLGVLGILPSLMAGAGTQIAALVQFIALIASALVVLALFYVAREVDEGRGAGPGQLFRALQGGNAGRLLIGVLGPQLLALLVVGMLLGWLVGFEEAERFATTMQELQAGGAEAVTPEALSGLPLGGIVLFVGAALATVIAIGLLTFTLLPDMIFGDVGLLAALGRSVRTCLRNLPAMLLFAITMCIVGAIAMVVVGVFGMLLVPLLGQAGAGLALNAIFVAVIAPISTNAIYLGWKQLLGPDQNANAASTPPTDRVAM
ncbi:MAG: hypothetical protein IT473_04715 [Lysobacter sp.]|nr:hypothetical protein [Lysobacter sp.]